MKKRLLNQKNFSIIPVSAEIGGLAAKIRSGNHIKFSDTIVISTAIVAGADYLVSNDHGMYISTKYIEIVNLDKVNRIFKYIENL
ncbi:PIN domain-containing protein [Ferroplasma sp.]|uniref:type II toxin-antitoxin system VapC family toxin n=1 Tax=Ferroplasma sp. TaxID=2591003 RepID=UPI00307DDF2C